MKKYLKNDFDPDRYAEFADESPFWSAPFGFKLLEYIDYKKFITTVDIGSGTGFPLTEIALRLGETCLVYGIDPWKAALKRAEKKTGYYCLNNVRLIEGYAESIPLADSSADLVTGNNCINNVNDIDKVLSECYRILKDGGQFIQTLNLNKTMMEFYDQMEQVLTELDLKNEIDLMHAHIDKKRPPLEVIIEKIETLGFKIKNIANDQFIYTFADGSAMLNHYFIRLAFMQSWISFLPGKDLERIFDLLEKKINGISNKMGSYKLTIPFAVINAYKLRTNN